MEITIFDSVKAAKDVWKRMENNGFLFGFQTHDYVSCWYDTIGRSRQFIPMIVLVSDDDGSPMMLWPLGIEKHLGVKCLVFPDAKVSDYNAPILRKDPPVFFKKKVVL